MTALALFGCVVVVVGGGLVALRWLLAFKREKLEHEPLVKLQADVATLKARADANDMRQLAPQRR